MKILAISDLHGRLPDLSSYTDVVCLVIAGDICPDFDHVGRDPNLTRLEQRNWLRNQYADWEQTVPAPYIFATPGNHDWVYEFPANCRSTMHVDEAVSIPSPDGDKHLWFTPWVAHCGNWNYQLSEAERLIRFSQMPYKLDLLVMHAPAFGCGDMAHGDIPAGCRAMRTVIQQKQPKHVVFGHIHEGQRRGKQYRLGGSKLYHVSMWGSHWKPVEIEI